MSKLEIFKNSINSAPVFPDTVNQIERGITFTGELGHWYPQSFLELLIEEIEELEKRCAEKKPSQPLKIPNYLNFQDEFKLRFIKP
ncbi:MAG TPA: hypothetical protein PLP33_27685 [Leptospiraceae bacterium]|nr:hypothetical protein [Leptospiraceae bacterium]